MPGFVFLFYGLVYNYRSLKELSVVGFLAISHYTLKMTKCLTNSLWRMNIWTFWIVLRKLIWKEKTLGTNINSTGKGKINGYPIWHLMSNLMILVLMSYFRTGERMTVIPLFTVDLMICLTLGIDLVDYTDIKMFPGSGKVHSVTILLSSNFFQLTFI